MKNTTRIHVLQKNPFESTNFNSELVVSSPGRINLIGEHIDYNGGHVLPAAISNKIKISFQKSQQDTATVWSTNFKTGFSIALADIAPSDEEWQNYILGVVYHINKIAPNKIKGFNCVIDSSLPIGAGISSSAALECGVAKGLNELFKIGLTNEQIITLSRDAEHTFVGTKCGIMDQFAVVEGKESHFLLLNCQNLNFNYIKAELAPYEIVLLNSNVSHNLASSEYNTRREECEKVLSLINKEYNYNYLCDVPADVLEKYKEQLTEKEYNRALYVRQENERTLKAASLIKENHIEAFGDCLYQSHEGLQNLYEVSCKELDFMVAFSKQNKAVIGARMMGGGFGGCTINLIHKDAVADYITDVSAAYKQQFNLELTPIKVAISNGVSIQ